MDYLLLFGSAFIAATLLPLYSEVVLFTLLKQGGNSGVLIAVAAAGNTLGAFLNWFLGRYLLRFQHRRWFYFSPSQIARAQSWFNRFGHWSLLFAWLPICGDALTLAAGVLRVPWLRFLLLVAIGKTLRYCIVVLLAASY